MRNVSFMLYSLAGTGNVGPGAPSDLPGARGTEYGKAQCRTWRTLFAWPLTYAGGEATGRSGEPTPAGGEHIPFRGGP
jgi:hypothetical protein